MAVKKITPVKLELNTLSGAVTYETPTAAADGFSMPYTGQDTKIVLLINGGTAGGSIVVKKGDSIQGVADSGAFTIGANEERAIVLEAGKYKKTAGDGKGTVTVIPSVTTIKAAAVVLP